MTPPRCQLNVCRVLPELRVVAVNGDRLRYIEGIFKDKLHVLSRSQAGVEQVLGGDGLAQHVGNARRLIALFNGFDWIKFFGQLGFLIPILTNEKIGK